MKVAHAAQVWGVEEIRRVQKRKTSAGQGKPVKKM